MEQDDKARRDAEAVSGAEAWRARLETILDNIVDGLVTIDERGIVQSYNKACERMFGYAAAEVLGQNVSMLMPAPYAGEHDGYLENYRRTGYRRIIGIGREVEARRKDGSVFPIDLSVAEMRIGPQRLYSGIIRDITERKLQEDRLRQAQKMEAVGQLTSGIAHDFNNLLTVVLGNTRLIRKRMEKGGRDDFAAELMERIDDIDAAARRGADLVRRLMVFTRQRPMQRSVVDVNACIGDIHGLLERALGEMIRVEVAIGDAIPPIHIDQDQFVNGLINMAVNARDAMPQGGVLSIETRSVTQRGENPAVAPGRYVSVTIGDTGTGMPDHIRTRIFEPFFTTKPPGEGTGLGLTMIYGLIQQSGGHIAVESAPGKGTVFNILIPAMPDPEMAA